MSGYSDLIDAACGWAVAEIRELRARLAASQAELAERDAEIGTFKQVVDPWAYRIFVEYQQALAAERALADRLAEALAMPTWGRNYAGQKAHDEALAAYRAARGPDATITIGTA